jgi:hypothetical protein
MKLRGIIHINFIHTSSLPCDAPVLLPVTLLKLHLFFVVVFNKRALIFQYSVRVENLPPNLEN